MSHTEDKAPTEAKPKVSSRRKAAKTTPKPVKVYIREDVWVGGRLYYRNSKYIGAMAMAIAAAADPDDYRVVVEEV